MLLLLIELPNPELMLLLLVLLLVPPPPALVDWDLKKLGLGGKGMDSNTPSDYKAVPKMQHIVWTKKLVGVVLCGRRKHLVISDIWII